MRWLADFVYFIAALVYLPVALYAAFVYGKNRTGWAERFGRVATRNPGKPRIWIHAVSLGEINATPRLVESLSRRLPDFDILVSTTTDTGYKRALQLYGKVRVFRFPLDFSLVVDRVLNRIDPRLIVLVELEVWYNLTRSAAGRGIPVAVVNGRLTSRSTARLHSLGPFCRQMFESISWVGAQDASYAQRFRRLGVARDRVSVTSSLKWDTAEVTDSVEGAEALANDLGLAAGTQLFVCGSTGPGEEDMILSAWARIRAQVHGSVLVIVPRKPERFDDVAGLIGRRGFDLVRRSEVAAGNSPAALSGGAVILGDTMGELRKFYSLASAVFVGRSLVEMGGSDPMEVAALGKPILAGPHMDNFRNAVEPLRDAGALTTVQDAVSLAESAILLLSDSEHAATMGTRGRQVVRKHQGATERTVDALVSLLEKE